MTRTFGSAAALVLAAACASGGTQTGDVGASPVAAPAAPAPVVSEPAQPRPTLHRDHPLAPLAHEVLNHSMLEHGDNMESLLWAALMIDHETTRELTESMAVAPRIARPPTDQDPRTAVLPQEFFDLQDEMFAAVQALHTAAVAHDEPLLADAYGRLATSCVTCHSLYLRTRSEQLPQAARKGPMTP